MKLQKLRKYLLFLLFILSSVSVHKKLQKTSVFFDSIIYCQYHLLQSNSVFIYHYHILYVENSTRLPDIKSNCHCILLWPLKTWKHPSSMIIRIKITEKPLNVIDIQHGMLLLKIRFKSGQNYLYSDTFWETRWILFLNMTTHWHFHIHCDCHIHFFSFVEP
mgnify:CR=1 FL=1